MPVRKYSELLPPEVHERLMVSVDARVQRQADKRAQLPIEIGRAILGRKRPDTSLYPEQRFTIPADIIVPLGRRLNNQPILRDKMTNKRREPPADFESYERYTMGGNKHNRRPTPNDHERQAKRQAMPRQTQNVADDLHRYTWFQLQFARTSRASLIRAREARQAFGEIDDTNSLYAASAIEDFGHCLTGNIALRGFSRGANLPLDFRYVGVRGAAEPHTLMGQDPVLFHLVRREQDKRADYWGTLLEAYEEFGGVRRTEADLLDEAWVDQFVTGTEVSAAA